MSAAPAPRRDTRLDWPDGKLSQVESSAAAPQPHRQTLPESFEGRDWSLAFWRFLQRLLDITVGACGLIVTFPLAVIIGWIIKRDSPGPAVFSQVRVAPAGKTFMFYKFRTLYADARDRWPEMYAYQYTPQEIETKPFKNDEDPRVTKVGKWLRRTTLDEIPNLYNLLKGDVTMVGPRPEIPEMLPYYSQEEMIKFSVKPGLTGLAQTTGRNHLTMRQTIEWDVYYVKNRNWRMDLSILLETVRKIIARDGAL
jgi:lipopolysaccharide/colanic/teichoic acid biosynthesis glycosyltransferase